MKRNSNNTDTYKLNKQTTLTVSNKPLVDNDGNVTGYYQRTVMLKFKEVAETPLSFNDPDEISDYINNIDVADNQMMFPGVKEGI